jgi:SAM-dependent methyltransferase
MSWNTAFCRGTYGSKKNQNHHPQRRGCYGEARWGELGLDGVADRVEFFQGDATNLKPQFIGYDLSLATNVIDRLNDPRRFLETTHEQLNSGGVLVIASPYTGLDDRERRRRFQHAVSELTAWKCVS